MHLQILSLQHQQFLIKFSSTSTNKNQIHLSWVWECRLPDTQSIPYQPSPYTQMTTAFSFLYARLQTGRIMVWWCPSVRPSGSPSVRSSQFSALFSYMLWHIDLKFCVSLYFYARKIKFECHQFPSLFAGVMLLFNFKILQICSFPHFSPTCFDILSSNFVYDFVLMYHRASSSVVILLQFLLELCLFVNLEYLKYTVFRTFLLHALTYWAEILHMTLFYCTTDQVRVLSICVNCCGSYAPFGT